MVYRGKVRGGSIVLEPGIQLPEGAEVRVEVDEGMSRQVSTSDPLSRMTDLAVETGIRDLATNIDHYLYGHPKVSDAG
jgi:hypothetical protein